MSGVGLCDGERGTGMERGGQEWRGEDKDGERSTGMDREGTWAALERQGLREGGQEGS